MGINDSEEIPQRIKPLDERILELVDTLVQWDFKIVKGYFPNEHEKSIYRALNKLENEGRIRYLGWRGRTKQYTTKGVSNLPTIPTVKGTRVDIKSMFSVVTSEYTEDYVWKRLSRLNDFPTLIGRIFVTAQLDEERGFKANYINLITELNNYRSELTFMLAQVDAIVMHPIMSGDPSLFKSIVSSESPDPHKLNEFKVWLTQFLKQKDNNDAASLDFD